MSAPKKKSKAPRTGGYYTTKLLRRVQEADPELMKSEKAMRYFRSMNALSTKLDEINAERTSIIDKLQTRSRFLKTLSKKKEFLEQLEEDERKEDAKKAEGENMDVDQTGDKKKEEEEPKKALEANGPTPADPAPALEEPQTGTAPAPAPAPEAEAQAQTAHATPNVTVTEPPPAIFSMPGLFGNGASTTSVQ